MCILGYNFLMYLSLIVLGSEASKAIEQGLEIRKICHGSIQFAVEGGKIVQVSSAEVIRKVVVLEIS